MKTTKINTVGEMKFIQIVSAGIEWYRVRIGHVVTVLDEDDENYYDAEGAGIWKCDAKEVEIKDSQIDTVEGEDIFTVNDIRRAISAGLSIGFDKAFDISNSQEVVNKLVQTVFLKPYQNDQRPLK